MAGKHNSTKAGTYVQLIKNSDPERPVGFAFGYLPGGKGKKDIPVLVVAKVKPEGLKSALRGMEYHGKRKGDVAPGARATAKVFGTLAMLDGKVEPAVKGAISGNELRVGFNSYFDDLGSSFTPKFLEIRGLNAQDEDKLPSGTLQEEDYRASDGTLIQSDGTPVGPGLDDDVVLADASSGSDAPPEGSTAGAPTPAGSEAGAASSDAGSPTPPSSDDGKLGEDSSEDGIATPASSSDGRTGAGRSSTSLDEAAERHTQDPADARYEDVDIPDFRDEVDEIIDTEKGAQEAGLPLPLYETMREEAARLAAFLMQLKEMFGQVGGMDAAAVEKRILNWFKHLLKRWQDNGGPKPPDAIIYDESCRFILGLCRPENLRDFLGSDSLLDADPAEVAKAKKRDAKKLKTADERLAAAYFEKAMKKARAVSLSYDLGSATSDKIDKIVATNLPAESGKTRGAAMARLTTTMERHLNSESHLVKLLSMKPLPEEKLVDVLYDRAVERAKDMAIAYNIDGARKGGIETIVAETDLSGNDKARIAAKSRLNAVFEAQLSNEAALARLLDLSPLPEPAA